MQGGAPEGHGSLNFLSFLCYFVLTWQERATGISSHPSCNVTGNAP